MTIQTSTCFDHFIPVLVNVWISLYVSNTPVLSRTLVVSHYDSVVLDVCSLTLKLLTCLLCKDIVVIIIFHSTDCQVCKNVSLLPEANLFLSSRFRKFIVIWVSQFRASLFPPYCRSSRCTARRCLARSSWAASDRRLRATCSWRLWGRSHFETH